MDPIRFSIENPVKVAVSVLLTILGGILALTAIPIQLTPDVDEPIIKVETQWTGRSPEEVEKEIVEEQEEKLSSITGLEKMTAIAKEGSSEFTLEFRIGTDIDEAYQEVSDKLREVPEYPEDVDEPVIEKADTADANAIAWIVLPTPNENFDIQGFYDVADKRIKPILDRVTGVSPINIYGGREREVHVYIDPIAAAQRGITFAQLRQSLRLDNVNVSAGQLAEGRRDFRIRTVGQYDNTEDLLNTVVTVATDGSPIRIRDIGDVELTLEKRRSFVRSKGQPALAFQVTRKVGANVMETMAELKQAIKHINEDVLPALEPDLKLELQQVYDETTYIEDAINLVQNNLIIGGTLAVLMLLLFLRVIRPTIIIALAIPISIVGTFVVMTLLGRNINVISLAGLAFSVGMVVDNAIVVLENIDRHLIMGKKPIVAAYDAAKEVWGAILASTLTTLVVFIPVIFMQEEAGQLFRDISIAICAAVTLSLVVSITVIPSASARWLRQRNQKDSPVQEQFHTLFGLTHFFGWLNAGVTRLVYFLIAPNIVGVVGRLSVVGLFTGVSLLGAYLLMPPTSYLPAGNRNLVFGIMFTPPGYNLDHNEYIGERVERLVRPYWEAQDRASLTSMNLPPVMDYRQEPVQNIPPMENYFFVSFSGTIFMGAASAEKENVRPLEHVLNNSMSQIPGAFGFAKQSGLFGRGIEASNAIDIELSATDMENLRGAAGALMGSLTGEFGYTNVRSDPLNFNLQSEEIQVRINHVKAKDLGIDVTDLGIGVQALIDGVMIGDYRHEGESIELVLVSDPKYHLTTDTIGEVPLAVRDVQTGESLGSVQLRDIAEITNTKSPQQINRIEQRRAIKLTVTAPQDRPLEETMGQIESMVTALRDDANGPPAIPPTVETNFAGTADKLTQVKTTLLGDWRGTFGEKMMSLISSRMFLALLVVYLVMAALFESFLYPLVILFAVPLATVGGFAGLAIVHAYDPFQQLDVLTMLGFVILIGVVVNNAILIVHQALNFMRGISDTADVRHEPMAPREAIRESVRTRMRPIFMTTFTSVFGMLPLVLMPGAGSELYKGLGSVVVGGLVCSTVFTLLVVPLLFSLVMDAKLGLVRMMGGDVDAAIGIQK